MLHMHVKEFYMERVVRTELYDYHTHYATHILCTRVCAHSLRTSDLVGIYKSKLLFTSLIHRPRRKKRRRATDCLHMRKGK